MSSTSRPPSAPLAEQPLSDHGDAGQPLADVLDAGAARRLGSASTRLPLAPPVRSQQLVEADQRREHRRQPRGERQVQAPDPQGGQADEHADDEADGQHHEQRGEQRPAVISHERGGEVGADAHEEAVAQRDLAVVPDEQPEAEHADDVGHRVVQVAEAEREGALTDLEHRRVHGPERRGEGDEDEQRPRYVAVRAVGGGALRIRRAAITPAPRFGPEQAVRPDQEHEHDHHARPAQAHLARDEVDVADHHRLDEPEDDATDQGAPEAVEPAEHGGRRREDQHPLGPGRIELSERVGDEQRTGERAHCVGEHPAELQRGPGAHTDEAGRLEVRGHRPEGESDLGPLQQEREQERPGAITVASVPTAYAAHTCDAHGPARRPCRDILGKLPWLEAPDDAGDGVEDEEQPQGDDAPAGGGRPGRRVGSGPVRCRRRRRPMTSIADDDADATPACPARPRTRRRRTSRASRARPGRS